LNDGFLQEGKGIKSKLIPFQPKNKQKSKENEFYFKKSSFFGKNLLQIN